MKKFGLLAAVAVLLTGCFGPNHPKMLSFTPASVVIDFTGSDLNSATNLAQQFCTSIDKDAQYVRSEEASFWGSDKTAFFNCVESARKNRNAGITGGQSGNSSLPIINNFK